MAATTNNSAQAAGATLAINLSKPITANTITATLQKESNLLENAGFVAEALGFRTETVYAVEIDQTNSLLFGSMPDKNDNESYLEAIIASNGVNEYSMTPPENLELSGPQTFSFSLVGTENNFIKKITSDPAIDYRAFIEEQVYEVSKELLNVIFSSQIDINKVSSEELNIKEDISGI